MTEGGRSDKKNFTVDLFNVLRFSAACGTDLLVSETWKAVLPRVQGKTCLTRMTTSTRSSLNVRTISMLLVRCCSALSESPRCSRRRNFGSHGCREDIDGQPVLQRALWTDHRHYRCSLHEEDSVCAQNWRRSFFSHTPVS